MHSSGKVAPPAQYIYLVRHGSRSREPYVPEAQQRLDGVIPTAGEPGFMWMPAAPRAVDPAVRSGRERAKSIAGALADVIQAEGRGPIVAILHSGHAVAEDTASEFSSVLRARDGVAAADLKPVKAEWLTPRPGDGPTAFPEPEPRNGVIYVGHQPELTRLARELLGKRLPGNSLPLGSAEVACVRLSPKPQRLLWLLTEKSNDLRGDLRQKIQSKFDVAKFFLSALVVNASILLSTQLTSLWDLNMAPPVYALLTAGYTCLLVSLGLSVATLLAFDRLTMPPEFWSETLPPPKGWKWWLWPSPRTLKRREAARWSVARPPSEASVVLFYEMTHVWTELFVPALVLALVAVQALLLAIIVQKVALSWPETILGVLTVTLVGLIVARDYERHAPLLGFED